MKKRTQSISSRGFTLIELLVVVAIIGLLAAMLFPAFSRARESARGIQCASNLKQIGMGLMQYAEDYNGRYPIAGATVAWDAIDSTTGNPGWMQQMDAYIKSKQIFHCASDGSVSCFSKSTAVQKALMAEKSRPLDGIGGSV